MVRHTNVREDGGVAMENMHLKYTFGKSYNQPAVIVICHSLTDDSTELTKEHIAKQTSSYQRYYVQIVLIM